MLDTEGTRHVPCQVEVHFTSVIQFYLLHMHTISLLSYWFLGINIASIRFLNPLESTGISFFLPLHDV